MRYIAYLLIGSLFSGWCYASEDRCSVEEGKNLKIEQSDFSQDSTSIDLLFPKLKDAELSFIELRQGGNSDLITHIAFEETDNGYAAGVMVSEGHRPFKLQAVYHYKYCYAVIEASVKNSRANEVRKP